jgi:hypothetical protein
MSYSLKEALEEAGVAEVVRQRVEVDTKRQEEARSARSANLQPHQRWWQNFRMSVSPFEIRVFVKVECEKWRDGLDYIASHNLNKVTTRCKTEREAALQIKHKLVAWDREHVVKEGEKAPEGALLYYRIYAPDEWLSE